MSAYTCPVPRYGFDEEGTFARDTIMKRWPIILKDTSAAVNTAISSRPSDELFGSQGRQLVQEIEGLACEIAEDRPFQDVVDDGGSNVDLYNREAATHRSEGRLTWHSLPWLWAECYLYRRLRNFFALKSAWTDFDPYFASKVGTFKSSSDAVIKLAHAALALKPEEKDLQAAFHSMLQLSLWGNATDLSLLAGGATEENLRELQSRGKEEERYILRNDESKVWDCISRLSGARCDVVLDNAGFELYTDLLLADFLVSHTPFFDEIVFHPKTIPWYVSDVLPTDFRWIISTLSSPTDFFPTISPSDAQALTALAARLTSHLDSGRFKLSIPLSTTLGDPSIKRDFWTTGGEYQTLGAVDPELLERLSRSGLVIFKGDLNYRRLTVDARWRSTTPFEEVLGPLNGAFPLVSLRTNKAEVIVGLEEGVEERTVEEDPNWRFNGKWAVVSFASKKD